MELASSAAGTNTRLQVIMPRSFFTIGVQAVGLLLCVTAAAVSQLPTAAATRIPRPVPNGLIVNCTQPFTRLVQKTVNFGPQDICADFAIASPNPVMCTGRVPKPHSRISTLLRLEPACMSLNAGLQTQNDCCASDTEQHCWLHSWPCLYTCVSSRQVAARLLQHAWVDTRWHTHCQCI